MIQAKDIEHVLFNEIDNTNQVIMYLEGNDWCAYERSAYFLAAKKESVVLQKEVVGEGYDVVLLKAYFPMEELDLPLSKGLTLKFVADGRLQFLLEDKVDGGHFPEWKKKQLEKMSA
ncbi:hypothetical protein LJC57_09775 [Parabacteroides sp. OttesenSCG-928-G07]|nr:hypothetical protein [Parabacteroides sp. OttesenSCG-928-G07]